MSINKHSEQEQHDVDLVTDEVLRVLHDELRVKRDGRWHYVLVVVPEFDEGDAVYRIGSDFDDSSLPVILNATQNVIKRRYPWQRRPPIEETP